MNKDNYIQELENKNKELEKILGKVLAAPKMLAIIKEGPVEEKGVSYYRCSVGGTEAIVTYDKELLFDGKAQKTLKPQTEVMIQNNHIVAVVPQLLKKQEKTPTFKLVDWGEIGGLKSQLEVIKDTIETPLKHSDLAKELGLTPSKGALLWGPPGCGKTLIAKAIASTILKSKEVDARAFVYIKGAELLSMYIGSTEQRIIEMFKRCREYKAETGQQAILFIDEAEAILPARGSRKSSDVETTIVPTFLAEMDGFEGNNPFVLLSTNLPDSIDSAILREGRIDIKVEIKRPTADDCIDIFLVHLRNVKCHEDVNCLSTIGTTALSQHPAFSRISGSMIEAVVKLSAQQALKRIIADRKSPKGVTGPDMEKAIQLLN